MAALDRKTGALLPLKEVDPEGRKAGEVLIELRPGCHAVTLYTSGQSLFVQ